MGHVMGLDHQDGVCATMNAAQWTYCTIPPYPWDFRCRVLELTDVRRAVAIYGGAPGPVGPEYCQVGSNPGPVTGLTAAENGAGGLRLSWRLPDDPSAKHAEIYARADGTCPASPSESNVTQAGSSEGQGSRDQTVDVDLGAPGHYCFAVFAIGQFPSQDNSYPRPGARATVEYDVAEPSAGPSP
jgi:hypothetical protein